MNKRVHYLGLDVHKETIAVAIAPEGSGEVRNYGIIGGTLDALDKLIKKLQQPGIELRVVYEAGPRNRVRPPYCNLSSHFPEQHCIDPVLLGTSRKKVTIGRPDPFPAPHELTRSVSQEAAFSWRLVLKLERTTPITNATIPAMAK